MALIGNQNVINKSLAYSYGAPTTTGSATTGVQFAVGIGSFVKPSQRISQQFYWRSAESSDHSSHPDGYNIGEAIYPAFAANKVNLSSYTRIDGTGDLTATATLARLSEATLSGSGDISQANLASLVTLASTLSGSGSVSQAALQAVSALASTLAGSGSISQAALSAQVPLEAALSGTGAVANTTNLTGLGSLEASILPFTELSPENLALSVASLEIENGYDLKEVLRLVSAALAGKLSGGGTSTVTIRDINDTVDRIVATVDSSGNRTDVTKDVS